ncbi:MAG: hypothetical protein O3A63_02010 [Proteobacteria bacterium]|nr:hypothetical protein [Pseudomonadota bacterium]
MKRPQRGKDSSGVVTLGGHKMFIKRLPLTTQELKKTYSTHNHHRLPHFFSYGIGSLGFGAWREVAAATKASNWVLDGTCPNFPMLYHHRILKLRGRTAQVSERNLTGYVEYWNNNPSVGQFTRDRANATHEVILLQEYIPFTLRSWFADNLDQASSVFSQLKVITDFLQSNGVVHFDCHHYNVLTDGERCYLTDFGLAMDEAFELTIPERKFLELNADCDWGTFVSRSVEYLADRYHASSKKQQSLVIAATAANEPDNKLKLEMLLLKNLEYLAGPLDLPAAYVKQMLEHRDVSLLMAEFYRKLIIRKTTRLDHKRLKQLVSRKVSAGRR